MENDLLLTAETLSLSPTLVRGKECNGAFTIKCVATQGYLTINEQQARVLEEFRTPRTVPEVLEVCIRNRTCLALRELYDLVLKAHRAGVLQAELTPPATTRPAVRWFVSLPPALVLVTAAAALAAAVASLVLRVPIRPAGILPWVYGWLITCGALSLGHLLTASSLRGGGCEVYDPRFRRYRGVFLCFTVDARDSCMSGRSGRAAVNASPGVPVAIAVAAGLWFRQPWVLIPAALFIFECLPVGMTIGNKLLYLARRKALLATDRAPVFEAPVRVRNQLRTAWRLFDGRVAALQGFVACVWAGLVGYAGARVARVDLLAIVRQRAVWLPAVYTIAAVIVVVLLFWLANVVQYRVADAAAAGWRRLRITVRRWRPDRESAADPMTIESLIRRNPLLQKLDLDTQAELCACAKSYAAKPWQAVLRVDDEPASVWLIVSGTASVYRRLKTRRRSRFLRLQEGDLFGAHKILDPALPGVEVRARTPLLAVVFSREDFQRLVIARLGAAAVRKYVHTFLFLQRSAALCTGWRPTAVARFAELASATMQPAGAKIILGGQEVMTLYVLCEGSARALAGSRQLGTIKPGEIFGEISLLQASVAMADVEVDEDSRCLAVNRSDFIRFVCRNHHVALQLEDVCSRRLGHPIFPLDTNSVV